MDWIPMRCPAREFCQLFEDIAAKEYLFGDRRNENNHAYPKGDSHWRPRPRSNGPLRVRRRMAHDGSRQHCEKYL